MLLRSWPSIVKQIMPGENVKYYKKKEKSSLSFYTFCNITLRLLHRILSSEHKSLQETLPL